MTVCADTLSEGNETFLVSLGLPTNAIIADGQATGTITDDDVAGTVAFAAATAQVAENAGSVTLTVQRSGPRDLARPADRPPRHRCPPRLSGNVPGW